MRLAEISVTTVGFEVPTAAVMRAPAVVMGDYIFWDIRPCIPPRLKIPEDEIFNIITDFGP
jgi:hypothetical protein